MDSKQLEKVFTTCWILTGLLCASCEMKLPKPPPKSLYRYVILNTGDGPSDVLATDLNLDGHKDLAIANLRNHSATIFYGRGDGSFSDRIDIRVFPEPSSITSADINEDGRPDLILNSRGENVLTLLMGNINGRFSSAKKQKTGRVPLAVLLEDFNRDDHIDAAVTLTFDKLEILLGQGNGKFKRGDVYTTGSRSESGVIADFNKDGKLDIALAATSANDSAIRLFPGNGDGTFGKGLRLAEGQRPLILIAEDMNRDNKMDIIATTGKRDNLILLYGKGNGKFMEPVDFSGGGGPLDLTTGHFNGDDLLDVAVANSRSSSFSAVIRHSSGGFRFPSRDYVVEGGSPIAIASSDFNEDGLTDIAVTSDSNNTVEIYLQKRIRE